MPWVMIVDSRATTARHAASAAATSALTTMAPATLQPPCRHEDGAAQLYCHKAAPQGIKRASIGCLGKQGQTAIPERR